MSTGDFARMDGAGYRSTAYDAGAAWAADVAARRAANPVYAAPMAQDEMLGGREDVNGLDLQSDQYAGGRRTVTIGNNQGVLAAMGAAGLSPAEQRAAYGQLIRSGQLTAADFDAKGMPKVQAGQEFYLDSNDYTPGDARLGGRLIGAESSNRTAIEVARATAQAAADRARWDTLQVGAWSGRTNQVTTGVQASGPAMVSQDVYTAAGDYAGSEMVPVSGAGAGMPYAQSVGKALAATVEIGYGAFKGVVNGVPEMAVGALKGYAYIGAGLRDGIDSATGAPSQNYLGRAIEAGSAYSGEVLSYEGNGLQRMGGYAGELLSPGAYAKAGELGVMGLRALGPTLDAAATNYMSKNGMMLYAAPEGGALSGANTSTAIPSNPTAYSVAFETKLNPVDFGRSRDVHFNRSNASLDNALKVDADFAKMMDDLIPNVQSSVSSVGGRVTPTGWTWEHASSTTASGQQGVMRLVPSNQHTPGSPFWRVLHPDHGAAGGYSEWAIPNGAPKN